VLGTCFPAARAVGAGLSGRFSDNMSEISTKVFEIKGTMQYNCAQEIITAKVDSAVLLGRKVLRYGSSLQTV
jgi:hypothetical protein